MQIKKDISNPFANRKKSSTKNWPNFTDLNFASANLNNFNFKGIFMHI